MKKKKDDLKQIAADAEAALTSEQEGNEEGFGGGNYNARFDKVVSTQCTLLDLIISGDKVRGGGIPGGVFVEIFGPSGAGKSALLASICASAQRRGGEAKYQDPEGRFDPEYAKTYEAYITSKNYSMPNTVLEAFEPFYSWKPKNPEAINVIAMDSLAALSTEMELEEEDKRGQKRAKDFSQELRKVCRIITLNDWVVAASNQVRENERGLYAPGGRAPGFYASLRLKVSFAFPSFEITRKVKVGSQVGQEDVDEEEETKETKKKEKGKVVEETVGIMSDVKVVKSTVGSPYREARIYIVFNYGIHDVMGNLQYMKEMTNANTYVCDYDTGKSFNSMDKAINFIAENNLEGALRERVIDMWEEIDRKFKEKMGKQPKKYF